eukprot:scaffold6317_cov98-Phaeocystis_antarctica.AAC.6
MVSLGIRDHAKVEVRQQFVFLAPGHWWLAVDAGPLAHVRGPTCASKRASERSNEPTVHGCGPVLRQHYASKSIALV